MKKILKVIAVIVFFATALVAQTKDSKRIKATLYFEPFNTLGWQSYIYLDLILIRYGKLDLRFYPFIRKNEGGWHCSYGEAEIKEVARWEALIGRYPSRFKDYIRVRINNFSLEGWKDALVYAGINPVEFEEYVDKNKEALLKKAYDRLERNKIKEQGVYILDEHFSGFSKITDAMDKINRFLPEGERLNIYQNELSQIKPPRFIALYDEETKSWVDGNIYASFRNIFPGITDEKLEFDKIDDNIKNKIIALPAYLIEKKSSVVEYLSGYVKQQLMDDIGEYYVYYDMRNMAKLVRKKQDNKIEIFVMSQCPFGIRALESIIDYIESGKIDKKNIQVHYIGDVVLNPDGSYTFNSLHGESEWKEDMRQLVIAKYYPERYWDYIKKRAKNYLSDEWERVASEVGIDVEDIKKRIESEGKKILADDFRYTSSLKINVSPTFLINGNIIAVGIGNLKKIKGYEDIKAEVSQAGGCGR